MNERFPFGASAITHIDDRGRALRVKLVTMLRESGRGHLASALSIVEVVRVLYDDILSLIQLTLLGRT